MPAMTPQQAGVVDAVLSNYSRGYSNPEFVASRLFPCAEVPSRNSRQIKFGKEGFRKLNTRRAPGTPLLTVQYGYASDPVSLVQDSLQGVVPVEVADEARTPGIDLGQNAVQMVLDQLDLGLEIDAANLARNPAGYANSNKVALTGAARWSDPASDPAADVKAAREAIRRNIGRYPNVMLVGALVFNALSNHPKIMQRFQYTSSNSLTEAMLAAYFSLDEIVVGKGVYLPDGTLDAAPATDIWGNDAVLAYVPRTTNWMTPSYGYTYRLKGYPLVRAPWFDADIMSWKYPTIQERRPIIVGADAGFLFQTAV